MSPILRQPKQPTQPVAAPLPVPIVLSTAATAAPAYRQIADQLRKAIRGGVLRSGVGLPPSRSLAAAIGIGRNTIMQAYDALAAEGWIESHGRHGTRVRQQVPSTRGRIVKAFPPPALLTRVLSQSASPAPPRHLDWRLGQAFSHALPLSVWRQACREAGRQLPPSDYGDPQGMHSLRDAIALRLRTSRSMVVDPSDIVITPGAGAAIGWLARLLLQPNDVCALENPGYPHAARVFRDSGAILHCAPVDDMGLIPDGAFQSQTSPALIHLTPAHQYPLGGRLSGPRRTQLLELCARHGSLIIENEYDHEFVYDGANYSPLWSLAPERVVLVSTFAKAISPSLRLGYIVAPPKIAQALRAMIEREDCQTSWQVQVSAQWLLRSGELKRHLRRVHRHYAQVRDRIRLHLADSPARIVVTGDGGGLHLVLGVPRGSAQAKVERALAQRGVVLDRLADFEQEPTTHAGILFGYGHMNDQDIERALQVAEVCLSR